MDLGGCMKSLILMFGFVVALTSCKAAIEPIDGGGEPSQDAGGNGKVQAKDFVIRSGRTYPHPVNKREWVIELYEQAYDRPCELSFPPEYTIDFKVTQEVGVYPLSSERKMGFNRHFESGSQSSYAQAGQIEVKEINNMYVMGQLEARFDANNQISGTYWAQICD